MWLVLADVLENLQLFLSTRRGTDNPVVRVNTVIEVRRHGRFSEIRCYSKLTRLVIGRPTLSKQRRRPPRQRLGSDKATRPYPYSSNVEQRFCGCLLEKTNASA